MSPDVLLECPRTSFRDVLRVNVTERVWHSPSGYRRYLYHHGKVQTTGGILRAAGRPWSIPAGK